MGWNDSVFLAEFQGGLGRALHTELVLKPLTLSELVQLVSSIDTMRAEYPSLQVCVCVCPLRLVVHTHNSIKETAASDSYCLLGLSLGRGVLYFKGIPTQRSSFRNEVLGSSVDAGLSV